MRDLKTLIEDDGRGFMNLGDLRVTRFSNGVLNVINAEGSLTQVELDTFRAALAEAGYRESELWIAVQNVNWLSGGTFAGVSMRVVKI